MSAIDYTRAHELVIKLDRIVEAHPELHRQLVVDGYDFWQAYRQRVFTFAKEWSRNPSLYRLTTAKPKYGTYIIHSIFAVYSFISLVIARIRGIRTLVYTTDKINRDTANKRDARLGPLYDALESKSEPYIELVHATYRRHTLTTMIKRKRPVIYYEVAAGLTWRDTVLPELNLNTLSTDEQEIARAIFAYCVSSISVSRRTMTRLSRLLKVLGIKRVFSIDDPRYYHELIAAGEQSGIKTYAFQHGHITKYHLGWLSFGQPMGKVIAPSKLYVWSPYWKKELERLSTHIPTESIQYASSVASRAVVDMPAPTNEEPLTVVIPYETDAPKAEVRGFISALGSCSLFSLVFKARADMPIKEQLDEYGIEDPDTLNLEVVTQISHTKPTIVIGTYSTYLYDMIAQYVPVGFLESSIDFGEALVTNELAENIPQDHTVCKTIVEAFERGLEKRVKRHDTLVDTSVPTHETVIENILNETHT